MNQNQIIKNTVIVTGTYYPETEEGELRRSLAIETLDNAKTFGYDVVVVDGSPDDLFRLLLKAMDIKTFEEEKSGMGNSRRQAMKIAYDQNKPVIAWTEPEKESYISQVHLTALPILKGHADIVVPKRQSLSSYPTNQQGPENLGNEVFAEITGRNLDMWFGPKTWVRNHSGLFHNYNPEETKNAIAQIKEGELESFLKDIVPESILSKIKFSDSKVDLWDQIFVPVIKGMKKGLRVMSVDIDYTHPAKQTAYEEGNAALEEKRYAQLANLIPAIYAAEKKMVLK